jgi:hypothetical protein
MGKFLRRARGARAALRVRRRSKVVDDAADFAIDTVFGAVTCDRGIAERHGVWIVAADAFREATDFRRRAILLDASVEAREAFSGRTVLLCAEQLAGKTGFSFSFPFSLVAVPIIFRGRARGGDESNKRYERDQREEVHRGILPAEPKRARRRLGTSLISDRALIITEAVSRAARRYAFGRLALPFGMMGWSRRHE